MSIGQTAGTHGTRVWETQAPYLEQLYGKAMGQLGQPGVKMPALPSMQQMTPATAGETAAQKYASSPEFQRQIGGAQQAWQSALTAQDVNQNPYLRSAITAATRPISEQFREEIMPGIKSGSLQSGGFGGTRMDIAQERAAGRAAQAIGDVASRMGSEAYGQGMQARTAALGMAPEMAQLGFAPSQMQRDIESARYGRGQQEYNQALQRAMYEQQLPWQQLGAAAGIIGGPATIGGGGGGGWNFAVPMPVPV